MKIAKAVSVYLLDQCSSAINNSSSSAFRLRPALGVENFHAAMNFATQTNVEFTKDITKSFTDRCWSLLTLKVTNATLFEHFSHDENVDFSLSRKVSRRTMNLTMPNDSPTFAYRFAVEIMSL